MPENQPPFNDRDYLHGDDGGCEYHWGEACTCIYQACAFCGARTWLSSLPVPVGMGWECELCFRENTVPEWLGESRRIRPVSITQEVESPKAESQQDSEITIDDLAEIVENEIESIKEQRRQEAERLRQQREDAAHEVAALTKAQQLLAAEIHKHRKDLGIGFDRSLVPLDEREEVLLAVREKIQQYQAREEELRQKQAALSALGGKG